jgi:hypothetical protein
MTLLEHQRKVEWIPWPFTLSRAVPLPAPTAVPLPVPTALPIPAPTAVPRAKAVTLCTATAVTSIEARSTRIAEPRLHWHRGKRFRVMADVQLTVTGRESEDEEEGKHSQGVPLPQDRRRTAPDINQAEKAALEEPEEHHTKITNYLELCATSFETLRCAGERLRHLFGFQADSVRNQAEHAVSLLHFDQSGSGAFSIPSAESGDESARYERNKMISTDAIKELCSDLVGENSNYERWCEHMSEAPQKSIAIRRNGKGDDRLNTAHTLMLWLCVWGEAANLRFCPEFVCYTFHCLARYTSDVSNAPTTDERRYFGPNETRNDGEEKDDDREGAVPASETDEREGWYLKFVIKPAYDRLVFQQSKSWRNEQEKPKALDLSTWLKLQRAFKTEMSTFKTKELQPHIQHRFRLFKNLCTEIIEQTVTLEQTSAWFAIVDSDSWRAHDHAEARNYDDLNDLYGERLVVQPFLARDPSLIVTKTGVSGPCDAGLVKEYAEMIEDENSNQTELRVPTRLEASIDLKTHIETRSFMHVFRTFSRVVHVHVVGITLLVNCALCEVHECVPSARLICALALAVSYVFAELVNLIVLGDPGVARARAVAACCKANEESAAKKDNAALGVDHNGRQSKKLYLWSSRFCWLRLTIKISAFVVLFTSLGSDSFAPFAALYLIGAFIIEIGCNAALKHCGKRFRSVAIALLHLHAVDLCATKHTTSPDWREAIEYGIFWTICIGVKMAVSYFTTIRPVMWLTIAVQGKDSLGELVDDDVWNYKGVRDTKHHFTLIIPMWLISGSVFFFDLELWYVLIGALWSAVRGMARSVGESVQIDDVAHEVRFVYMYVCLTTCSAQTDLLNETLGVRARRTFREAHA